MACLKEADFLKHRGQIVSNMQKKDHNQLWLGLQNGLLRNYNKNFLLYVHCLSDKFDQFWAVNRKLMEVSGEQDHFKYIPFRCYIGDGFKQKLIKPVTEDGRRKTLQEFLQELFPGEDNGKNFVMQMLRVVISFCFSKSEDTWHDSAFRHTNSVDV